MIEKILKGALLILLSIIYLPALAIIIIFENTWKELLEEFGL
jgi:hypothetical protein